MRKIGVIGCGYVGLVAGVCLAELGHIVTCMDADRSKIDSLNEGVAPIYEPGLGELIIPNVKRQRLLFTNDIDSLIESELVFVAVGTPNKQSGEADLSQVERAILDLERVFNSESRQIKIVVKSTVPVGTGNRLSRQFFAQAHWLSYVSNPEFLREGSAVYDFMNPDRIVVGANDIDDALEVAKLYERLNAPVITTSIVNAELIKYASNAFLATKISFINEIANICEGVGADVNVVSHGMGLDPRINPHFLKAGIGYGGSCFPKDVRALKQIAGSNGYHFELLSAVIEVNEMQKYRVIQKLRQHLGRLEGREIAVLGLAFKPNTDDIRNSVAIELLEILLTKGVSIVATDPLAIDKAREHLPDITCISDPYEAVAGVEAIIIATEDPLYMSLDWESIAGLMAGNLIIDGRNILSPEKLPESVVLEQIGRPNRASLSDGLNANFEDIRKVA
ncbi:MAG: UDP-glucose/GDP-mannose dehydrogenase family protein [Actinobacteria bacterium]|nr:UDP-glucose/GDP-mannose dehydrogenase family protein [Actinomycetota bacterium]